ncbi:hypothetical protein AAG906_002769 [Vitis piasezkii]
MRSYGEDILDQTVVAKVLRSLTPKFDHVVAAIEDEAVRIEEKNEEKAFYEGRHRSEEWRRSYGRGRGGGGAHGRGGRGRGREDAQGDQRRQLRRARNKSNIQCYYSQAVWTFLDSGCSNHMTGIKSLFKELDESHKLKVKLVDTPFCFMVLLV